MLSVFICYGGPQGEEIGNRLRNFLRREGFDAFLASPRSPDIPAGLDFSKEIERKLRDAHVMVAICDSGILSSQYALHEIDMAKQLGVPIIPFREENTKLPSALQNSWAPVVFKLSSPGRKFRRLQIEIYRLVLFKLEFQGKLLGAKPSVVGIPPKLLRS